MEQIATTELTDTELVRLTLEDKNHFGFLIERYEAKLGRYINRLGVRRSEDQDDVLQEIFIKVYRNLYGFDTSLSFSSWVYRIAHNEAISWYRKSNVRPEGHLIAEGDEITTLLSSKEESREVLFDQTLNAVAVNKALKEIDAKYREVLVLRFFEHKEYDEISDILKIPIGSVGTLIHRGKKQLAAVLKPETIRI
jgi:RNA polymerase sigma-70 factor (ECF subfamily)